MTTAWVFRGGAGFGAAQVGMARALLEAGHHPDMLYGASAGALNAASLAADPSLEGLERLAGLWTRVRRRDVFPVRPWALLAGQAGFSDHTVSPKALAKWLRSTCLLRRLEDGVLPLTVVTTDVQSGDEVLLASGPAVPALMASSAIPGVFPPVLIDGRWLMDGSIACDTPVGPAVRAGATRVWVLQSAPAGRSARPRTAFDAVLASSSALLSKQHRQAVRTWSDRCELFVLPAPFVPGASVFSFTKSEELMDAAYRLTSAWLRGPRPTRCGAHEVGDGPGEPVRPES